MLKATTTPETNKRKRVSDCDTTAASSSLEPGNNNDDNNDDDISIHTINPSNVVDSKDRIERAKISKLLHLKKERETIDCQRRELDFLEKFILNRPITIAVSADEPQSQQEFPNGDGDHDSSNIIINRQKALSNLLKEQGKQNIIRFNVRGKIFITSKATIEKRENMLRTMLSSNFGIDTDSSGAITLDCNPDYFQIILEHIRTGSTTHCGVWEDRTEEDLQKFKGLLEEADFFGLEKLANVVKSIIKEIESNGRQASKKQSSLDCSMVSSSSDDKELKEQEYIENFMSLTITEKENADKYFTEIELKIEQERQQILQREQELLSACSNPELVFSVRGVRHAISIKKIVSHPECMLNDLLIKVDSGELDNNEILIDRDPEVYQHIFTFLQHGSFTIPNEEHLRKQIYREAKALNLKKMIDYFDPLRFPLETIGEENIRMREEEDYIRQLFATDRNNPLLKDPYLFLINVFENQAVRDGFKKETRNPSIPLIFNFEDQIECSELTWRGTVSKPKVPEIVANKDNFIAQFNAMTCGIFKDADFSNMVVAGGSICACLLNHWSVEQDQQTQTHETKRNNWDEDDASEEEEELDALAADNVFTDSSDDEKRVSSFRTATPWSSNYGFYGSSSSATYNQSENQKLSNAINDCHEWSESDIDIFLYGLTEEQAEEKLNYLFTLFKKNLNSNTKSTYFKREPITDDILIVRTQHAITFYLEHPIRPVQVILRIYSSITEVLCGFDIDSVCCAFDGNQVFALPRFKRAIKYRMNMVDPDRQSTTYETRLIKYAKRGFRIGVAGYNPEMVRNEYLTSGKSPFYYRRKYRFRNYGEKAYVSRVTGLARILLYKQAHKYARNVRKSIVEEELEKAENDHDYKQLYFPFSATATPTNNYNTTLSVVNYFKEKLDKKPHFEFALNDLFSVLHASGDVSTLEPEIKWLVIEPGTQKIGSFNPTTNNFFKDAYSTLNKSSSKKQHQVKKAKAIYTWWWQDRNTYHKYDESTCATIEKAYREFKTNSSKNIVIISDTHLIDLWKNKQISRSDSTRQRKVQRSKSVIR